MRCCSMYFTVNINVLVMFLQKSQMDNEAKRDSSSEQAKLSKLQPHKT